MLGKVEAFRLKDAAPRLGAEASALKPEGLTTPESWFLIPAGLLPAAIDRGFEERRGVASGRQPIAESLEQPRLQLRD